MEQQAEGGWQGPSEERQGGRPPANPLAVTALVLSIAALPLGLVPAAGLAAAIGALAVSLLARKKVPQRRGMGRVPARIGLIVSVIALVIGLGSTAIGAVTIYLFNRLIGVSGLDPRPYLASVRERSLPPAQAAATSSARGDMAAMDAIAQSVREAEADGSTPEARRVAISADLSAFQRRFQQATGREVTVDMDGLSQRLTSANPLELVSLQQFIKSAAAADLSDAALAERMGDAVQSIFTPQVIQIGRAPVPGGAAAPAP